VIVTITTTRKVAKTTTTTTKKKKKKKEEEEKKKKKRKEKTTTTTDKLKKNKEKEEEDCKNQGQVNCTGIEDNNASLGSATYTCPVLFLYETRGSRGGGPGGNLQVHRHLEVLLVRYEILRDHVRASETRKHIQLCLMIVLNKIDM